MYVCMCVCRYVLLTTLLKGDIIGLLEVLNNLKVSSGIELTHSALTHSPTHRLSFVQTGAVFGCTGLLIWLYHLPVRLHSHCDSRSIRKYIPSCSRLTGTYTRSPPHTYTLTLTLTHSHTHTSFTDAVPSASHVSGGGHANERRVPAEDAA